MKRAFWALTVLTLAGCGTPVGPDSSYPPRGARPLYLDDPGDNNAYTPPSNVPSCAPGWTAWEYWYGATFVGYVCLPVPWWAPPNA